MARKLLKISKLRKKAWGIFSQYIRRRSANKEGLVKCCTCEWFVPWHKIHSGHFLHGHTKATFLEEMNVHGQCISCNLYRSGNLIVYYDFMIKTYGQEKVDWLKQLSHAVFKPTRDYYDQIILKYKGLLGLLDVL